MLSYEKICKFPNFLQIIFKISSFLCKNDTFLVRPSISTYFRFRKFVVPLQRFLKPNFVVHEQLGCDVRNGDVFIFINGERKQKRQELARPIMVGLKAWMESEGVK